jgi:hypothetical protein
MSKHTPGPWTVEHSEANGFWIAHDPRLHGDMKRGMVVVCEGIRGGKEIIPNARLVAAAPDLLTALQTIALHITSLDAQGVRELCEAAIAKATGKETE